MCTTCVLVPGRPEEGVRTPGFWITSNDELPCGTGTWLRSSERVASACSWLGSLKASHASYMVRRKQQLGGGGGGSIWKQSLKKQIYQEMLNANKVPRRQTYCGLMPEARFGYVWKFPQSPVLRESGFTQWGLQFYLACCHFLSCFWSPKGRRSYHLLWSVSSKTSIC